MKRFTLAACAGLLAAAMASPSFAADMPRPAYQGARLRRAVQLDRLLRRHQRRLRLGQVELDRYATGATTGDFNINGALVGGTIGYNLQTGSWVWGVEADIDCSWIKGTDATACCETKNDWLGDRRAAASATPWIAGCPTSPAARPLATSR